MFPSIIVSAATEVIAARNVETNWEIPVQVNSIGKRVRAARVCHVLPLHPVFKLAGHAEDVSIWVCQHHNVEGNLLQLELRWQILQGKVGIFLQ